MQNQEIACVSNFIGSDIRQHKYVDHFGGEMIDIYLCEHLDTIKNIGILNLCQATYLKILYIQAVTRFRLCRVLIYPEMRLK